MPSISYYGDTDIDKWLRRKYAVKEEEARAARIQAEAERRRVQLGGRESAWRYGPGGLVGEELARRYPYGLPEKEATTSRLTALHYGRMAGVREREVGLAEQESEWARSHPEVSSEDLIKEIKRIVAKPGASLCPEGYRWNGEECVPVE